MQNVILENATENIMDDDNVVYYAPEYMEMRVSANASSAKSRIHTKSTSTNSSNFISSSNHNYGNFNFIATSYMYAYVANAIRAVTAVAAVASVAAATATTSNISTENISSTAHERLKFVYDNSASLALDENVINHTLFFASSAPASFAAILNDTWFNSSSSSALASSSSPLELWPSPSSSSVAIMEEGVNVTSTAVSEDWSHFYDLILSWQGICLIVVFCTLIVITIIGNTLIILAVITTRRLKTVTNCFVMSLAVADLLVGIFVMPPSVAVHLIGSWRLGWILCDIWISLDVLLCTASILSLCAISVDRYLAVTQPLTYSRKRRSKRLALIMILIVWVLALAITCPPILGWYEPGRRDLKECRYNQNEGYVIFSAMGSFFIPMAVMIYVYARISCVIASRHDNMTDISVHNKKFKRYTSADVENELDPDLSELDLSSGQKKQQAARTLSNQTLAKELHEIMASETEGANVTQCHSLLALPATSAATSPNSRNGCYELTRPSSLRRTTTASSNITVMTSTTGTGTATASTNAENPWTFSALNTTTSGGGSSSSHTGGITTTGHHYQQHTHPNKHMRTHSVRHQHYLSAPPAAMLTVAGGDSLAAGSTASTSILRQHSQPVSSSALTTTASSSSQQRAHHHGHGHHYTTKSLSNRITSLKKENKTTQTLSIVVGGFIACWLPFFINYLITPFLGEHQVSQTQAYVLTWLGWFNSAINPFIYAFYSVDFRAAFWRLTCKRFFSASSKPQFPTNTMSIRR